MNSSEKNYTWTLEAVEDRGNLRLKWNTTDGIRAQQSQVRVYSSNSFPTNPADNVQTWVWTDTHEKNWDTGLRWGSDWHCAIVSESNQSVKNGQMYVIQVITTDDQE